MRVLDLFSGIGGFSLGLERAGMKTLAFCEIDPFCRAVLRKHWPSVPIFEDVRTLRGSDVEAMDVICGGFPCQDISVAGKGAGLAGERSGLWFEYTRLVGEVRPAYVIVENVAALLGRGMGTVLGDLASIGYDAEWRRISARDVGAPHLRQRIWIVAYPSDGGQRLIFQSIEERWSRVAADLGRNGEVQPLAHAAGERRGEARQHSQRSQERAASSGKTLGNTDSAGLAQRETRTREAREADGGCSRHVAALSGRGASESDVGRVVDGPAPKLDGGGLNVEEHHSPASPESRARLREVRGVRRDGWPATSPSGLQQADRGANPLQAMPRPGGSAGRTSSEEAAEELQGVQQAVHADAQQEPHDMQPRVPFSHWPHERGEAVGIWSQEPDVPRVAKGVANRVARLRGLGNAVVPQIPEIIGRAILAAHNK